MGKQVLAWGALASVFVVPLLSPSVALGALGNAGVSRAVEMTAHSILLNYPSPFLAGELTPGDLLDPQPQPDRSSIEDLQREVEEAVGQPRIYRGLKVGSVDDGRGLRCAKSRTYSVGWRARTGESKFRIWPDGTATMRLELANSEFDLSWWRKGGILCMWSGGDATLGVGRLSVDLKLTPVGDEHRPHVGVQGLVVEGLRINRVDIALPFLTVRNGSVPAWFMDYVSSNTTNYLAPFILRNFGDTIDETVGNRLYDLLSKIRRNGIGGT